MGSLEDTWLDFIWLWLWPSHYIFLFYEETQWLRQRLREWCKPSHLVYALTTKRKRGGKRAEKLQCYTVYVINIMVPKYVSTAYACCTHTVRTLLRCHKQHIHMQR